MSLAPFARNDLRHGRNLHFAERQTLVVKTEGRIQFNARTVTALDEHRHIQLHLGEPIQAGRHAVERVAVEAAQQNIGAARPQFGVAIKDGGHIVGVIARRQFQPERHPGGHVREKPGIDAFESEIADGAPGGGAAAEFAW